MPQMTVDELLNDKASDAETTAVAETPRATRHPRRGLPRSTPAGRRWPSG